MPSANKAKGVFDSGKTYSYHIKSVHSVQSSKASANFKLVFRRDMGDKRMTLRRKAHRLRVRVDFSFLACFSLMWRADIQFRRDSDNNPGFETEPRSFQHGQQAAS